jgi:uncharacterized protein (DUF3084 family)
VTLAASFTQSGVLQILAVAGPLSAAIVAILLVGPQRSKLVNDIMGDALGDVRTEIAAVRSERDEARGELAAARSERDALHVELRTLRAEVSDLRAEVARLRAQT